MKFPHVQYMVGVAASTAKVEYFWGATRTEALEAAGNPSQYFYVRFDRGPVMQPNGQPAPKRPYKRATEQVL